MSYDTQTLVVVDSAHPVATRLPGTFAPANTTGTLQSVNEPFLPAGADPVAARAGELARHVVYTVPAGGVLGDGSTAAAARVALGYTAETVNDLSDEGYQLLDNAIYWADDTVAPMWVGGQQVALEQAGRWNLDRIPARGSTRYTPSASNPGVSEADPREDGILNANTPVARVAKVAENGTRALDFPGWNDDPAGQEDNVVTMTPARCGFRTAPSSTRPTGTGSRCRSSCGRTTPPLRRRASWPPTRARTSCRRGW